MTKADDCCRTCYYWQDVDDRVYAMVSGVRSNRARNTIELRRCRYSAPPAVPQTQVIYTDEATYCCEYKPAKEI